MSGLADVAAALVSGKAARRQTATRRFWPSSIGMRGTALAAVQLVQAQPSISSQLIDNLNASIHLRALLTDLFLIDEILKRR